MSLKNAGGANSRPVAPIGNHVARLAQVIDLGTQADEKYGDKHKVRFTYELSEELRDFGKGAQEPFLVSRVFAVSTHEKSSLRKILDGMKGSPLTGPEIKNLGETLRNLIGAPCMVNVVHAKVGGSTYANIEGVAPIPAKLKSKVPALRNEGIFFDTDDGPDSRAFLLLPAFLQSQIAKCKEWGHDDDDEGESQLELKLA